MTIIYIFFFLLIAAPFTNIIAVYSISFFFALFLLFGNKNLKDEYLSFSMSEIYYIAAFWLLPVISLFYSISRYNTINGIYGNFTFILLLIILKQRADENSVRKFLLRLSLFIPIVGICGIIQEKSLYSRLKFGFHNNPNILADVFAYGILIIIFLRPEKKIFRVILPALVFFFILTKSLGGAIAIGAVLLVYYFYKPFFGRKIYAFFILLSICACILTVCFFRIDRSRLDPFANKRFDIINCGIKSLQHNFFFGTGQNTFNKKHMRFIFPVENSDMKYIRKPRDPHNVFLLIWNETGIAGMILFCLMLITIFFDIRGKKSGTAFLGAAGIALLVIHNLSDTGFSNKITNYFFVLFIFLFNIDSKKIIKIRYNIFKRKIITAAVILIFCVIPAFNISAEFLEREAINLQQKGDFYKAAQLFEYSTMITPENSEAQQALGGCYRELYYKTGNTEYVSSAVTRFYYAVKNDPYNGLFKINMAKILTEFNAPKRISWMKYYTNAAINAEPYSAVLYYEAAELAYLNGDTGLCARAGLIHEPYFLRLAVICSMLDVKRREYWSRRVDNIRLYGTRRLEVENLKEFSSTDRSEAYYYEILHKNKIFKM